MGVVSDHSAVTRWEHFAHDADLGVRGFGPTPAAAFEQAALAMSAAIFEPGAVRPETAVEIVATAPLLDILLVDWLNALVFEMAERRMAFGAFSVVIEGERLRGRALGEKIAGSRHKPAVEVKGATFTELAVVEDRPGFWRAQCVIDV